ncbi:MAG: 30S ribosomal protein S18 [Ruminococcaceae bacterium]|nr:30S ribosomal protein S18 [Oscillospiraceae bacterium]
MDNNTNKAEVKAEVQKPFRPKKRKKVCTFCADKIEHIDYKDTLKLRRNLSERSKILPRRVTGTCAKHQRQLTTAVKRARHVALLPYVSD